mgnify:CR=1 FL=1
MVYRIYVEKKPGFDVEANGLKNELTSLLGIKDLTGLRLLNRYDVEGIDEALFNQCVSTVFSEPPVDNTYAELPAAEGVSFAVEYLPGQFDQRAASAAECIQLISQGERPLVRSARVYLLEGALTPEQVAEIKKYVINPVEAREASLETKDTLKMEYPVPAAVAVLEGFNQLDEAGLAKFIEEKGLAMDLGDIKFCQEYFRTEQRDPTITEIKMIDTYWSDHCRHTTFGTILDDVQIDDAVVQAAFDRYMAMRADLGREEKPRCMMDLATIGAKELKKQGILKNLDESEEINACTVKIKCDVNGKDEDWLFLFKNETHNHPTEIEPFGGAATCIGGAIRDPLSGRSYVYQAMRVTGAGDPLKPVSETLPGKLPQRKLVTTAAAGYSSYGNQIGLATGQVDEIYHPGYVAKRMEIGAVVGATPASHVRRECPAPGDVIVLLGGRTGRDGIGGATGSSKSHNRQSLTTMASEVQKGNAPEERKIQRLFRNGEVTRLIKRCNDFGAGGVSVAIGELADGLEIELDAVRKKYEGLDGTELAISESQERMAVVVAPEDEAKFIAAAQAENLEAYRVAVVTESPRMVMHWRGQTVADLSRAFLDTNGAVKHASVRVEAGEEKTASAPHTLRDMAGSLKSASRRGLTERFDSTVGAFSLLMPFGGKTQRSPSQAMAALLPVLPGSKTEQGSVMAWGCDPDALSADPYTGAHSAVYTSVAKIVAAGADYHKAYLTLQEFFEKLRNEPVRWGKPFAALLGALDAQLELGAAAIGGKDSMSGTFLDHDVPPTLISFAIAPVCAGELVTTDFKSAGHGVYLFYGGTAEQKTAAWERFTALARAGKAASAWAVENGLAEAVMKMSLGNEVGFAAASTALDWYRPMPGAIVAELTEEIPDAVCIGITTAEKTITIGSDEASISELLALNDAVLESVYPTKTQDAGTVECFTYETEKRVAPAVKIARPKALIPVFPGTNCEYDTHRALLEAGADAEQFIIRNLTSADVADSVERFAKAVKDSQIIVIPGGFSGGDEPDGSAKLITAFFRNAAVKEQVTDLLEKRDGLMLGVCNGFQALIKLGLVPYGKIMDTDADFPTLTYNVIGRHQSRLVRTRVCSNKSPWLAGTKVGDIYTVPISHGEGRFLASEELVKKLAENGQIATQYVDLDGYATMDAAFNPNGSICAIEGITSPDGRVFGKMGHTERIGKELYRNVPGQYEMELFTSAVRYFK